MFPDPCTLIRAWVLEMAGRTTPCEPSLGTADARAISKDIPPLVESMISTFVAFTAPPAVPPTLHVTVRAPDQFTAVFGAVTVNGPVVASTVTSMSSISNPPPPERLSRTVILKFSERLVVGSFSPVDSVLLSRSCSRGNVRTGSLVGSHVRKMGLAPLSASPTCCAAPRSRSSHAYVNVSPLGSLPDAVNSNGVLRGIV